MGQATDGDHSMLSGKPLGGYRCMACDRPLAALDSRPGPHLPTGQLPVSLASGAEVVAAGGQTLGKVSKWHVGQGWDTWHVTGSRCIRLEARAPLAKGAAAGQFGCRGGCCRWPNPRQGMSASKLV